MEFLLDEIWSLSDFRESSLIKNSCVGLGVLIASTLTSGHSSFTSAMLIGMSSTNKFDFPLFLLPLSDLLLLSLLLFKLLFLLLEGDLPLLPLLGELSNLLERNSLILSLDGDLTPLPHLEGFSHLRLEEDLLLNGDLLLTLEPDLLLLLDEDLSPCFLLEDLALACLIIRSLLLLEIDLSLLDLSLATGDRSFATLLDLDREKVGLDAGEEVILDLLSEAPEGLLLLGLLVTCLVDELSMSTFSSALNSTSLSDLNTTRRLETVEVEATVSESLDNTSSASVSLSISPSDSS